MPTQSKPDPDGKKTRKALKKDGPTPRRARTSRVSPAAPTPQPTPAPGVEDRYAPTAWGSSGFGGAPSDLEMPSGQVALVRRPGVQQLIIEGVLHKMDNLTALVDKKHIKKGKGAKPSDSIDVSSLMADNEALAEVMHTVDRVVCAVVVRPQVAMTPADVTRRQSGVIYADSIGIQDKMFIFNWSVGGSKDLESFRRESEELVGSLAVGESVEPPAE